VVFLHWDLLQGRLGVVRPVVLPELLVKVGQLFIKLASGLGKLIEACPMLDISGAVTAPRWWSCLSSVPRR
jgi:hypothetical protein